MLEDYDKNQVLITAAKYDHIETVKIMIERGATDIADAYGLACIKGSKRSIEYLNEKMIDNSRRKYNVKYA